MAHTPEFLTVLQRFTGFAAEDMAKLYLAAVVCAAEYGRVTADDLRAVELDKPDRDKRIFGGALAQLKRKGVLVIVGETQTKERDSNGRPIKVFALAGDWRSHWLKDDKLPVPAAIVDLKTPHTESGTQVAQDDLLALLARVNDIATQAWANQMDAYQALEEIRDATARWAPALFPSSDKAAPGTAQKDMFVGPERPPTRAELKVISLALEIGED